MSYLRMIWYATTDVTLCRMYELFVGPPELDAEWDDRGIDGVNRFLKRLWNLLMDSKENEVQATKEMIKQRHRMVADITMRLESFSLNTVISGFMEYNNKFIEIAKKEGGIDKENAGDDRSPAFSICTSFCRGDMGAARTYRDNLQSRLADIR